MRLKLLFLASIIVLIGACHQSNKANKKITLSQETNKNTNNSDSQQDNTWKWEDCIRGEPEPICDSLIFPDRKFYIDSSKYDRHIGYEQITLKNGDVLKIENVGCEYYTLILHLTTSNYNSDTKDYKYWATSSAEVLNSIKNNLKNVGFNWKDGISALENFYKNTKNVVLEEQIDFNDSEIRNFVSLDKIEKLPNNKYQITVSFSIGPL